MATRREALHAAATVGLALASADLTAWADGPALAWQDFPANGAGFFRAPVLLSGQHEAVLVDGGFTLTDGRALAEAIRTSDKKLTTIYVSQSDPDYYFSLGPVKAAFPKVRIVAASATVTAIRSNVEKKLAFWGPQLGENGPRKISDIVMPEPYDHPTLDVEGHRVRIVAAEGLANRRYLWVPELHAILGGVLVFSGLHVWIADTPTTESRTAWVKTLEAMAARNPQLVIPGHRAPGAATDVAAIHFTRDYLLAFEEELAKAADSGALIAAMRRRYPDAAASGSLEISAKVAKGEMKWSRSARRGLRGRDRRIPHQTRSVRRDKLTNFERQHW